MQRALAELRVEGIKTTVPLHQEILGHAAFRRRPHRHDVRRTHVLDAIDAGSTRQPLGMPLADAGGAIY